jgi:hypothetical protein
MSKQRFGVLKFTIDANILTYTVYDSESEVEVKLKMPLNDDQDIKNQAEALARLLAKRAQKVFGG